MPDKEDKPKQLNERQKAFCKEYILNGWNAAAAYSKAYKCDSIKARIPASLLLTNINIKDYITELRKDIETLVGINKEKVLQAYNDIAFNSIEHYNETWINRKTFESLNSVQKSCIAGIETREVYIPAPYDMKAANGKEVKAGTKIKQTEFKFTLYSRMDAMKEIKLMMGYNAVEKRELSGPGGKDLIPEKITEIEIIHVIK